MNFCYLRGLDPTLQRFPAWLPLLQLLAALFPTPHSEAELPMRHGPPYAMPKSDSETAWGGIYFFFDLTFFLNFFTCFALNLLNIKVLIIKMQLLLLFFVFQEKFPFYMRIHKNDMGLRCFRCVAAVLGDE
jgi:hypothetical protein